jgi:hypothetical protein
VNNPTSNLVMLAKAVLVGACQKLQASAPGLKEAPAKVTVFTSGYIFILRKVAVPPVGT